MTASNENTNIDKKEETGREPVNLVDNPDIKRILIIKWSSLGDIANASAIIEDVCNAFPNATIDLNTLPAWTHLFEHDPRFNEIISIDVRKRGSRFRMFWQWIRAIRARKYDLVVDLQSSDRSRMMLTMLAAFGSKIPWRIGMNDEFPYNIRPSENCYNTFRRNQSAIRSACIPANTNHPVLHYSERNENNVRRLSVENNFHQHRYAVYMPGCQADSYLKRWGHKNYAELGVMLHNSGIEKIILVGTDAEYDECARIEQECGDWVVNLCGKTEILDLIPLCENASYIVTNDNGTARVAGVSDRPTVMIFGPTDRERDLPGNANLVALQPSKEELDCVKCFRKHCDHHTCMKLITPEQVFIALQSLGPP